jgi:hypothetical protein
VTLRRPKNPGSRPGREWTPAQRVAFTAFRLRALWHQAAILTGERRDAMRAAVDAELERIGFESETVRHERRRREWELADAADRAAEARAAEREAMLEELPF